MNMKSPEPAASEVRTGAILTDRPCARCGFNLYGQAITREPVYQMLVARCPECGTVAALQEYPALGRWAGRWAAALAALWLLLVFAAVLGVGAAAKGYGTEVHMAAVAPLAQRIAQEHQEYQAQAAAAAGSNVNATQSWLLAQGVSPATTIETSWWASQDGAAIRSRAAQAGPPLDLWALWDWRGLPLIFGPIGLAAGIALVSVPRRRLWWVVPALMLGAAVFMLLVAASDRPRGAWAGQYVGATNLAAGLDGRWIQWTTIALATLPLGLGAWLGRPVARMVIRGLLPPAMRASLAVLWTCDGLPPPSAQP